MRVITGLADIEEGIGALVARDGRLAAVVEVAGDLPLRLMPPGYTGLANIVVSQMVSKASAAAIWQRLTARVGDPISAASVLALTEADMRAIGLSGAKATTLARIASAVDNGSLDLETICTVDGAEALSRLQEIKGIGRWTAEVYLMFCAGHPDIFPIGDVALRNAVAHAFGHETRLEGRALEAFCESWSPWRSVAARLFWAYYSRQMRRDMDPLG